ncbi:MAG: SGNH/GDSL hydrolase family protein [Thermoguttaceae bacterium]|nr:SGNH/GDSL hydrolase family protein [Thermoguttaceae bacterium]
MKMFRFFAFFLILTAFFCVTGAEAQSTKNTIVRGSYTNSQFTFESTGKGRVAFLGGSITEMDGYRPMVCEYLQKKFPNTEFDFIAAGIASTCSDTGAFRLESDVLSRGPVDLFFLEFAVNDDQDGNFSIEHSIRGFEGIVRHIRTACPNVDIVVTFFVNENLMAKYRQGDSALSIQAHSLVTEKYGLSVIDLAKEIQEQIDAKKITWGEFGGVHPAPRGNRICADMIEALLNDAWKKKADGLKPHALPEMIDEYSYSNAGFRSFDGVALNGFTRSIPDWKAIRGGFRQNFGGQEFLHAQEPGASCTFDFEGRAVSLFVLAGPDSGAAEVSIDGGDFQKAQIRHRHSGGLHYPRTVILADELAPGKHTVTLRIPADGKPGQNALRIYKIGVAK